MSSVVLDRPVGFVKDDRLQEAELAYIDSCHKRVAEWADAAQFSPELVLERLTEECQRDRKHVYEGLRSTFTQATANSSGNLDEATFITLMTERIALPSHILQRAGPILFDIVAYASSLPFPSQKPPAHLNLDSLIRGVAILTPSLNPLSRGDESSNYVVSRRRTEQDARRIIFQSIASPGPHAEETSTVPQTGDTVDREDTEKPFFIDVSAEDVRTTDLLDALVVSQPDQSPYMTNVARCFFKDIASNLLKGQTPQQSQTLHSLRISKEKFQDVLQLVLVLEAMESGNIPLVMAEIEKSARRLMEGVVVDSSVGWKGFEEVVNKTAPNLVKQLGGLLGTIFGMGGDAAV